MRATLLIVGLSVALAATAQAQEVTFTPNDPATRGEVMTRMGESALHYWRMNGIVGCQDGLLIVPFAVNPGDPFNAAYGGGCGIDIGQEYVEWVQGYRHPVADDRLRRDRRSSLRDVCRLIVHETGHALGLEHSDRARFLVMGQYAAPHIPACGRLARELVPDPSR